MIVCPACRTIEGLTLACAKKDGHYIFEKNPHRTAWITLGLLQRMFLGATAIRVEWFDA